jgi:hypothetical protein
VYGQSVHVHAGVSDDGLAVLDVVETASKQLQSSAEAGDMQLLRGTVQLDR